MDDGQFSFSNEFNCFLLSHLILAEGNRIFANCSYNMHKKCELLPFNDVYDIHYGKSSFKIQQLVDPFYFHVYQKNPLSRKSLRKSP